MTHRGMPPNTGSLGVIKAQSCTKGGVSAGSSLADVYGFTSIVNMVHNEGAGPPSLN